MTEIILYTFVLTVTYFGVRYFRFWSLQKKLLDVPNERSSHKTPTPRGGGLVVVAVSLLAYLIYTRIAEKDFSGSYLAAAFLIALVSWLDDVLTISFVWRFLVHTLSAVLIIFFQGYFREVYIPFVGGMDLGIGGAILTFLWIVWLTNAFNFMDGIDGLAGLQAVITGIGWLFIGKLQGFPETSALGGILAFASLAFLFQNWHPAKIFMGDVGSAFLGFSFAVMPLLAKNELGEQRLISPFLPLIAGFLVWLFLFDTVFTFARRVFNREKVWKAHRSHIYQKLVIAGYRHSAVSLIYGGISFLTMVFLIYALSQSINSWGILYFLIALQSSVLWGVSRLLKGETIIA